MPTESEIKSHLADAGLAQDQLFRAFRAVSRAFEEAEERNRRDIEADKARVVDLIRGAMV